MNDATSIRPAHLSDFEGLWRVERVITPASGPAARFSGTALWAPENDTLRYREDGQLHMAGQPAMKAEREYIWTRDLDVLFPDGRFFHTVPLDGTKTQHWCDPDTYSGRYNFDRWPVFHVTWAVKGPNKDYTSQTKYRRC